LEDRNKGGGAEKTLITEGENRIHLEDCKFVGIKI
jgi:hypothetical protein